jgi:hypothetical protein
MEHIIDDKEDKYNYSTPPKETRDELIKKRDKINKKD